MMSVIETGNRVVGLDGRLSPELACMALDLADERRSASRDIPPELWLCLGEYGGERGVAALVEELASAGPLGRRAAVLGLAGLGGRAPHRRPGACRATAGGGAPAAARGWGGLVS